MKKTKIAEYDNGNVHVTRFSDGTVIRYSEDDEFDFAFSENLDVKITDVCDKGCPMCHEGSTPDGKHGDIMRARWVDSLHPYTEIALGGGNVFEHPDFIPFLKKLKDKGVYANVTVNQIHFLKNKKLLHILSDKGYIHGIGVSLVEPTEELFEALKEFPNAVLHVIAGILNGEQLKSLIEHGEDVKLLILGYKKLRRGADYYQQNLKDFYNNHMYQTIDYRIKSLERVLELLFKIFKVISFDCLAIEQLHVKDYLPNQIWDQFFQGEDGTMTFYIDMVNDQFAESSTAPLNERRATFGTVDDMFQFVKEIAKERHNKL